MLSGEEIVRLYSESIDDYKFAIENFFIVDTGEGPISYTLTPRQRDIVDAIQGGNDILVAKPRQAGVTTTVAAIMACVIAFNPTGKKEKILIMANKLEMAKEFLKKIKEFLEQIPRWAWGDEYYGTKEKEELDIFERQKKSQIHLILPNGSEVKAVAQSKDALRGYSPTFFIAEECAFWEKGFDAYAAAMAALGASHGKYILISTPNGYDSIYYDTYNKSYSGKNKCKVIEMRWYEDPRFNSDLRWKKITDKGEEIIWEKDSKKPFSFESYEEKLKNGYKPISDWYLDMCDKMNQNPRQIAQELDVSFLGSGGNVIDAEILKNHSEHYVDEPIAKYGAEDCIWVWEEPDPSRKYLLAADISKGDSDDFSTFVIIDIETKVEVAECVIMIHPDLFAEIIFEWGSMYNGAYAVIDANGVGTVTALKLVELGYKNIHYDNNDYKVIMGKNKKSTIINNMNKTPGFKTTQCRDQLVNNLIANIRDEEFCIRSKRLINQFETWVWLNGRADHMKGKHDDIITALMMGLIIIKFFFNSAKQTKEMAKTTINSWLGGYPTGKENINTIENKEQIQKSLKNPWVAANVSNDILKKYITEDNNEMEEKNISNPPKTVSYRHKLSMTGFNYKFY